MTILSFIDPILFKLRLVVLAQPGMVYLATFVILITIQNVTQLAKLINMVTLVEAVTLIAIHVTTTVFIPASHATQLHMTSSPKELSARKNVVMDLIMESTNVMMGML